MTIFYIIQAQLSPPNLVVLFELIYYEAYRLKADAEARELYLKTCMGRRISKQLSHHLKQMGSK